MLVLTETTGFRHESIPDGVRAIQRLGRTHRLKVDTTSSSSRFTSKVLNRYDAVIFLSATGTPIGKRTEQRAFERYIQGGGGYLGVHAASDTRGKWAWYEGLVGARFTRHAPGTARATVRVEDRTSAATKSLPAAWVRTDEWYSYRANPRANVRVLLSLDETTYSGGGMGDHPITWCQNYGGGRSFYTGLGHTQASYTDPNFTRLLLGGLRFAAGAVTADCTPRANPAPTGTALRSKANNKFVSTAAGNLLAGAATAGTAAERFDVVPLPGGNVALRSKATGLYVCAENAGSSTLIANRAAAGAWETFALITNADGTVSLRATVNNKYVAAENAGAGALIANRDAIGAWEKFDLVTGG